MSKIYDWQRFWCFREDSVNMDEGFLYDPSSKWGNIYNPNVKPIEEFLIKSCLVLLGEPGLGKSFEVERNRSLINGVGSNNAKALVVNLNTCQSASQLEKKIIDNPIFEDWRTCEQDILYLTLESLDECLIRVETLTNIILEMLKESPRERLYLRIVCRTGYWPTALEVGLRNLWDKESVGIIELMPLRRVDVKIAAQVESVDFAAFIEKIGSRNISSFAARPITLKFLLSRFKTTGDLPDNQIEMYDEGCLMLCEEVNPARANTSTGGRLPGKFRLIIASRIAAALIFSGKTTIWTTLNDGSVPDDAITFDKLVGIEQMDGHSLYVDNSAILETLATGLFSARGQNILGWSHQTYAEYLAANYLRLNFIDDKKIMSLITVAYRGEKSLIPQLFPVVAWIAGMMPTIFRQIMSYEPEILLFGDISATSATLKAEFLDTYLKKLNNDAVIDWEVKRNFRYDRIRHSQLAEQIRPYIENKEKNEVVRTEAIRIAEECRQVELGYILGNIALDRDEPLEVRINAVIAVYRIGKSDDKERLKMLATQENNEDCYDQLKGYALMAVWPEFLTAEEMFCSLTSPKRSSFSGSYSYFISEHLLAGLKSEDIPTALQWVLDKDNGKDTKSYGRYEELPDRILQLAWGNLDTPGVLEKLANAVIGRMKHHKNILGEIDAETINFTKEDFYKRRKILDYLVLNYSKSIDISNYIISSRPALIAIEDIEWIIEKLTSSITLDTEIKKTWGKILNTLWYWDNNRPEITLQIYELYQNDNEFATIYGQSFAAIELSSEGAQRDKEWYYNRKKWEERNSAEKNEVNIDIAADVNDFIIQFGNGNLDAWWRLCYVLTFDNAGMQIKDELLSDLTACPGWGIIDGPTQEKIVEISKMYLLDKEPYVSRILKSDNLYMADFAGVKAIRLLYTLAPAKLHLLPVDIWEKWTPVIVFYPDWTDSREDEFHQELLALVYSKVPKVVIEYVAFLIDRENKRSGYLHALEKFDGLWNDDFAVMLLAKVRSKVVKPEALRYLLQILSNLDYKPAFKYAKNALRYRKNKVRAKIFAAFILFSKENTAWNLIWDIIKQDSEFGKSLMLDLAFSWERVSANVLPKLNEEHLGEFYLWLVKNFPYEEDPKHEGVFSPTGRDEIIHLRSSVLEVLKSRGNDGAIVTLSRIVKELPEVSWLTITLTRAQKVRRQKMWIPPKPEEVLAFVKDSKSRLVKNGEQLLDIVIDALFHIQLKMQGETPISFCLWDKLNKKHCYRPKGENDFSDLIKILLEYELVNRGVILNREVEIRRNRGNASGQRTDIHVEAISNTDTNDVVRVIIEAKGCWNDELESAMATQLVHSYLTDNECKHGIYLVGWFNCEQWDISDSKRRKQAFKHRYNSLVAYLEEQAKNLSIGQITVKPFVVDVSLR